MADSPRIKLTPEELLEHSSWVKRLALQLAPSREVADDAVQETWLAALQRPPRTRESVGGWLRTVVQHAVSRLQRGEAARRRREIAKACAGELPSAAELVERAQGQRIVAGVVLQLPEPYRSTLLLKYFEGLTLAEIARRTGAPEATVRSHHLRALREVRERLVARGHADAASMRATAAFLAAPWENAPGGQAVPGTLAIGSLVMTTKVKAGWALVLLLSLIGLLGWWRPWSVPTPFTAPFPGAPPAPTPATTAHESVKAESGPSMLVPARVPTRLSRVTVIGEDGAGILQAVVIASDRPRATLAESGYQVLGVTDANGSLLSDLSTVPASFSMLSAHHPAWAPAVERRPVGDGDVTFRLRAGETAVFECRSLGRPVPDVLLRLSQAALQPREDEDYGRIPEGMIALAGSAGRHNVFTASSDESGRIVMTGLPRGKYGFEVECRGHAPKDRWEPIEVPMTGPKVIELSEIWVWALAVDANAPDVIAWKHPGRPGGAGSGAHEARAASRLRRNWPGALIDTTAFEYPGGVPPPGLRWDVLHTTGASQNEVRAVRLADFTGPQPEAPIRPTTDPNGSSVVTIRVVDQDGEAIDGFRGYWVQKVGWSPFVQGQWIPTFDSAKATNRYLEGDYEIRPAASASEADFDVVKFHVGKETPTLDVTVRLKRRLRPVRIELVPRSLDWTVPGMITIKGSGSTNLWFTGALDRLPWLPVGETMQLEANSFGCLPRIQNLTVPPGRGVEVVTVELEQEPE
jgi:RNA polymerase sigma-70 factor (ECF subfamily)